MRIKTLAIRFILPIALVVIWQIWGMNQPEQSAAPIPSNVVQSARDLIGSGELPQAIWQSLQRVITGLLVAAPIAIILGLLMGQSRWFERNIDPIIESFRPVAPIALLPLAILWFGSGTPAAVFIVAYASFFPLIVNTIFGVKDVDKRVVQAARTMGVGKFRILQTVIIPSALPSIFVGFRLAMGLAWTSIVAAELAVGAKSGGGGSGGIGQMMFVFYAYSIKLDGIVVCMIAVGIVALLMDYGFRFVERKAMPWAR